MRTVDKPVTNAHNSVSFTIDQLRRGISFRNISSIINELKQTATNFTISTMDKEPIIDIGEASTIDRPKSNKQALTLPKSPGDIVHADILFGSGTAIGGAKYALFLVDRATRHKYIYPIRSLKQDITPTLQKFFLDLGRTPKLFRTDFDHKLMGSAVEKLLTQHNCRLESAPPELQNQNGICERNWRSILVMARSWLASSLLPNSFWWFALKRATEVSNYIPLRVDGKITTPHQLVYGQKVDLRNIFPMFSVAYTSYKSAHSYDNQTVRTIVVGRSDHTNTLLFYHPSTKKILTSARYKLDERLAAGPTFNLQYDGGMHFSKYCDYNAQIQPPTFAPSTTVYVKHNNSYIEAEVITIPMNEQQPYTVQYKDGSLHQHTEQDLTPHNPLQMPHHDNPTIRNLPLWVKHNSKCTLFLNKMKRPRQGYLIHNNKHWQFRPGHALTNKPIDLPDLEQQIYDLIETSQLFKGHLPFPKVIQARQSSNFSSAFARHISAKGLTSLDVPTLLQHKHLNPNDKAIWDSAYAEEYYGLKDLPAWTSITEQEFKRMRHKYKAILPTMAISCIKFDEHGQPKRTKYRIVVLGNLDPYSWSKSDCYSPVMSLLELRLLTALAVKKRRVLKNGDVKQAFCQAKLPPGETYVLTPPPGCPLTPPKTLWLLNRTLYGLKRSPRHWYDKACQILKKIGLKQCPNAPCLFHGHILPGKPPIYLGLYVDDFVYFSEDDTVERYFEDKISQEIKVEFMGQVSYFLGIRFQWRQTDNNVKVHLSQEAFADNLIQQAGLHHISTTTNTTPYKSGAPVDTIKPTNLLPQEKARIESELRSYVGSLLWLSQGTRPDLATITSLLAQHQNNPSPKHIDYAKYAIKYIKGTKTHGIQFSSDTDIKILSFLHFPISSTKISALTDANWGPQDQSVPKPYSKPETLETFKSRSISGHIINLHGPIHWSSKRQRITARSSAEAEVYATDECVRDILYLRNVLKDLNLLQDTMNTKTEIYNDNMACVLWSSNRTTKGMRHIQIRENATKENAHLLDIKHISGKINPADILSKEDKDPIHFTTIRDRLVPKPFPPLDASSGLNTSMVNITDSTDKISNSPNEISTPPNEQFDS